MKALSILQLFFGLVGLPFGIYGSWLLYNHVHATDLMWFVWTVSYIGIVMAAIFSGIVNVLKK